MSIGCFKEDLNNPYFNVSAGNYVYKQNSQNSSVGECVEACSSLHNGYKLAALTPEGVCLCSSALTGSLQKADSNTSCLYGSSDGLYFIVYPITPLASISIPGSVMIFEKFPVNISTVAGKTVLSYFNNLNVLSGYCVIGGDNGSCLFSCAVLLILFCDISSLSFVVVFV